MKKYLVFVLFALMMPLANWFIGNIGTVCLPDGPCLVPVGWGLLAPSGVLFVGFALVLRDVLQDLTNWKWSILAVLFGGVLSFITANPYVAIASASAFVLAEILDTVIYTPLLKKGKHVAVLISGLFGAVLDSLVFVYLAFGSFDFSTGTVVAKLYASFIYATYLYWKHKK